MPGRLLNWDEFVFGWLLLKSAFFLEQLGIYRQIGVMQFSCSPYPIFPDNKNLTMVHLLWLTNQHSSLTVPLTTAHTSLKFLYFFFKPNFIFHPEILLIFTLFLSCHVSGVPICLWQFHGPVWLWLTLAVVRNTGEMYCRCPAGVWGCHPTLLAFHGFLGRKTSRLHAALTTY